MSNTEQLEEALRATIMKGTIDHLLAEMTPERMAVFADAWLAKVFTDLFSHWRYGGEVDAIVKPVLLEQVKNPVFVARVQVAIQQGLDRAITELPDKIAKQITEAAMEQVKTRLQR